MKSAAVLLTATLTLPVMAQHPGAVRRYPLPSEYSGASDADKPTQRGENGDARWSSGLLRYLSNTCNSDVDTYIAENKAKKPGGLMFVRSNPVCVRYMVAIRNDSAGPLQCKVIVELATADVAGFQTLEIDRIIYPADTRIALRTYVLNRKPPKSHSVDCTLVPSQASAGPPAAECEPTVAGPPTAGLYPVFAGKSGHESAVTLEYTLTSTGVPHGVRVVESSGVDILDDSALYYSKFIRATSPCTGQRARLRVRFADPLD